MKAPSNRLVRSMAWLTAILTVAVILLIGGILVKDLVKYEQQHLPKRTQVYIRSFEAGFVAGFVQLPR